MDFLLGAALARVAMEIPPILSNLWQPLLAAFALLLSLVASAHAVLYKRDSRAAFAWALFSWVTPLFGPLAYFIFGINRIRRRAQLLRTPSPRFTPPPEHYVVPPHQLAQQLPPHARHFATLAHVGQRIDSRPLLKGNRIDPLINGDEAYPAMLEAIHNAKHSIGLSTYIFDRDDAGSAFLDALTIAVHRKVQVRVLIDATGALYSRPSMVRELRQAGVPVAKFLPASFLNQPLSINLRNHRKILVTDGLVAFTGGMNIRAGHWHRKSPAHPVQDVHFRLEGPVVHQLQSAFADDWHFTTREVLDNAAWFPGNVPCGDCVARTIADGPDDDFDKLRWCLLSALNVARHRVRIVTPYFLPDPTLISALNLAAMRGVRLEILLPEKSNLPYVHWASRAQWWQILERGCLLFLSPPPFDHSKIVVVDDAWCLIGSANWDPRSLRLNFELNIECFSTELAEQLNALIDAKLADRRPVTLEEADSRGLWTRLVDGTSRLMSPYM